MGLDVDPMTSQEVLMKKLLKTSLKRFSNVSDYESIEYIVTFLSDFKGFGEN